MTGARVAEPGLMEEAVKYASAGGGAMGVLLAWVTLLKWFVGWLTGRLDLKQQRIDAEDREIDQKWRAYREALEGRVDKLEEKVRELEDEIERCHAERRELLEHVAQRDGFATGRGEARQLGQIGESARRVIDGEETG